MPVGTSNTSQIGWAVTLGTSNQLVIPPNPSRTGIIFVNPGGAAVAICPATQATVPVGQAPWQAGQITSPVLPALITGVAIIGGAGSITINPNDKFIIDNLPCTTAWNGVGAIQGAVLTIYEII